MTTFWEIVFLYFAIGLATLIALDIMTGRVHSRFRSAAADIRVQFAETGRFVGNISSFITLALVLWLFWPVAIYGALASIRKGGRRNGQT